MYREVGERNSNRGTDTTLLPPGTSTFRVVPPSTPANSYYPSHGRPDGAGVRDPGGAMRPSGLIKKVNVDSFHLNMPHTNLTVWLDDYRKSIWHGPPSRFLLSRGRCRAGPLAAPDQPTRHYAPYHPTRDGASDQLPASAPH